MNLVFASLRLELQNELYSGEYDLLYFLFLHGFKYCSGLVEANVRKKTELTENEEWFDSCLKVFETDIHIKIMWPF